ncbi:fosfomycin resistance glutathione transferase [Dongia sp.]|uniref:fosfomycin resistance glutathione transferase n=1 Tax=Dongia sp. TaxID=1977262 RepID=UPI0035AFEFE1
MITGLNHLTLAVRDLDVSFRFYAEVLGLKAVARWPKGAYLAAGDLWLALTLDDKTRAGPLPEYTHAAFTVSPENFQAMRERIIASGAETWQQNSSEGESHYFIDPNGHKLEIHVSGLAARIAAAKKQPWDGLQFFD